MRLFKWLIIAVCVLRATAFAQVRCHAQLIPGDSFAVLAQSGGAVLLNGGGEIGPTGLVGTYIVGNVGIGSGGLFFANGGILDGSLTFADSQATVTANNDYSTAGSFDVVGAVNYGDPGFSVTDAVGAAEKDSAFIGSYTATQTYSGISILPGQTQTITGVSGTNVIKVNGDLNITGGQLFFQGPADAVFYVNVSGQVSIDGGISETLNGRQYPVAIASANPGNVLVNMTGANEFFGLVGNGLVEGSVLNVNGSSEIGIFDSALEGQIVSDTIDISDGQVLTPEGSSLTMVVFGMLPVIFVAIRCRSKTGATA